MLINAYQAPDHSFHWLDAVDPTGSELEQLYQQYDLHQITIQDFLDPKHLPKYENIENQHFIILRSFDEKSKPNANTIRDVTRKLAIFIGHDFIITLHRRELSYIKQIREQWIKNQTEHENILPALLNKIVLGVLQTFNQGLNRSEYDLERFENGMFKDKISSTIIKEEFVLKHKAFIFKRLLKMTLEILPKLKMIQNWDPPALQDLQERAESAYYESDDILEYVNGLIMLHLSLASHKTNEIIRLLTVLSVFFLPLTFVVGVYGMNFDMPEFKWRHGYLFVWTIMIILCIILYIWFRRKGLLKY